MLSKSFVWLLLILFAAVFGHVFGKLYYIEVKYPLLEKSVSGSLSYNNSLPLWPMPQYVNNTSNGVLILVQDQMKISNNLPKKCDIIEENVKHYKNILFPAKLNLSTSFTAFDDLLYELSIEIDSKECPEYPDSSMDESYDLKVTFGYARIQSKSVWGALRGLDTFSQLVFLVEENRLAIKNSVHIRDFPRFSYRGLLIDTARHYIPVPILKRQIDAMSYNKFNVLHWHIVDDQSFPFESLVYPNLTINGRFSKAHVYTRKDIRDIIEHARLRAIRVIPEFDTPGHVESFGRTFPKFITVCWNNNQPYQAVYSIQGEKEILNPTLEELYPVLENIFSEFKDAFKDEYIHLGMDEVYYECWKSNPNITEWMLKQGFTQYNQLEAFYSKRVLNIVKGLNKKATVWQDVYDNGVKLEKGTQVQIWKDQSTLSYHKKWFEYLNDVTRDGYAAILSSPWYINFVSYGIQEFNKFYLVEPFQNFQGTKEQAKLLIGGEACLWGEYVDGTNIESRIWPRASAIAERLWSPANVNDAEEAKFRVDEHRCRMLRRGIMAAPVLNGFCGDYEHGMEKSLVNEPEFNYNWMSKISGSKKLAYDSLLLSISLAILIKNYL